MLNKEISKSTVKRLPTYLSYLKGLPEDGSTHISATALAAALGMGEVQVRKDLALISDGGRPKIGYLRETLIHDIEEFLGYSNTNDAVLVGAGKLGRALLGYGGFAEYGLKAEERRLYQLHTPDLGTLFHEVLELFSNKLEEDSIPWTDLTKEKTEALIEACVDEAAPRLSDRILMESAANKYLIRRLKRVSTKATWTKPSGRWRRPPRKRCSGPCWRPGRWLVIVGRSDGV